MTEGFFVCYKCGIILSSRMCSVCGSPVDDWPNKIIDTDREDNGHQFCRDQKLSNNK